MLKSLFGDLAELKKGPPPPPRDFAATALLDTRSVHLSPQGRMVDRHHKDLFVTGSAAQAMRDHLAESRSDLDAASRRVTLIDPGELWAGTVIRALSDASGHPVERLQLRDQATLRTMATIERTELVRRDAATLKIYHPGADCDAGQQAAIAQALMERSHMTAVIVDTLQPRATEALLAQLHAAAREPDWQCPALLFLLPPSAGWLAEKITAVDWPAGLRVHLCAEPLAGVSSVWNAVLSAWDRLQEPQAGLASGEESLLDPRIVSRQLNLLLQVDGVESCAVVDTATGAVLAGEQRAADEPDLGAAAAACAIVMRAQLDAARAMGLRSPPPEEVLVTAGTRQQLMRNLARRPGLFLLVWLDRSRANLALTRFKLIEAEKALA
jgi:hypothetical protein